MQRSSCVWDLRTYEPMLIMIQLVVRIQYRSSVCSPEPSRPVSVRPHREVSVLKSHKLFIRLESVYPTYKLVSKFVTTRNKHGDLTSKNNDKVCVDVIGVAVAEADVSTSIADIFESLAFPRSETPCYRCR